PSRGQRWWPQPHDLEKTVSTSTIKFDPTDPATLRNPYDTFARMRAEAPVHWSAELSAWLAVDAESVQTVLTTPTVFSANRLVPVFDRLKEKDQASAADVMRWLSIWMVFQDPPNHTRLRRHLAE